MSQTQVKHTPLSPIHQPTTLLNSNRTRGEGVEDDERGKHGAAVVGVKRPDQGQAKDAEGEGEQLRAGADERAEEGALRREAEDVAVHVLPARLLQLLGVLVVARVLDKVVLEHAQQDGGQEAGEQQHGDAGVDDGEPVDLQVLLEELVAPVLVHAPREGERGALPGDRVGEGHVLLAALGQLRHLGRVGGHVDLDHAVLVVRHLKVDVREEVELLLRLGVAARLHRLHLAHVAPDGQVVVVELEVVVLLQRLAEGLDLRLRQVALAQRLLRLVHAEGQVVRRRNHAVAVHHLAQRQQLAVLGLGLAKGEVVVLVRLRGAGEGTHCTG